jgi:hypothetical protein
MCGRFIELLCLLGVYCLCTAMCGLSGVKRERRNNLAAFIALLALLVLAEAGATLLLLTDNSWRDRIPGKGGLVLVGRRCRIHTGAAAVHGACRTAAQAHIRCACAPRCLAVCRAAAWRCPRPLPACLSFVLTPPPHACGLLCLLQTTPQAGGGGPWTSLMPSPELLA